MKKQMMTYILMGALLMLPTQISATQTLTVSQLAEDVFIEGISENAVLYVGEEMYIRGYVDEQATQQEITWQVTGNDGIIDFDVYGNEASIVAKAPGTVWIMARATDGSNRAREYAIRVQPALAEESNPGSEPPLSGGEVTPPVEEEIEPPSGGEVTPPVEEEIELPSGGEVTPPVEEEIELPSGGEVTPPVEEEIELPSGGEVTPPVEEEIEPPSGGEVNPSVEEEVGLPNDEENNKETADTLVTEDIIILGGTGESLMDPIIITLNKALTSEQKIALMNRYLKELQANYRLRFMSKEDNSQFTAYTLKVAEAKNDFFIEIRVEKEDQEMYIPIIEMLDDIKKEVVQGINKDTVVEKGNSVEAPSKVERKKNTLAEVTNNQVQALLEVEGPTDTLAEAESHQVEVQPEVEAQTHTSQDSGRGTSTLKEGSIQVDTGQVVTDETKSGKELKLGSLFVFLSLGAAFVIKNSF